MEVLKELSDEFLTCSICLELFHDPKQLPCLHSFCRNCLCKHIMRKVGDSGILNFQCPVCRKVTHPSDPDPCKLADWVDEFPDNFFIIGLMETLEARRSELNERRGSGSTVDESGCCTKHTGKPLVSYCTKRKVGVCQECSQASHKECNADHINPDVAKGMAEFSLLNFQKRIEELTGHVEMMQERITSQPRKLKLKKEQVEVEISEFFSDLKTKFIRSLLDKEKEVMADLFVIADLEEGKICEARDECKSLLGSLEGTQKLFDKLLKDRPLGALAVVENVEKQIGSYERAAQVLGMKENSTHFEFVPSNDAHYLVRKIGIIGKIQTGYGDIDLSFGEQEQTNELVQAASRMLSPNVNPASPRPVFTPLDPFKDIKPPPLTEEAPPPYPGRKPPSALGNRLVSPFPNQFNPVVPTVPYPPHPAQGECPYPCPVSLPDVGALLVPPVNYGRNTSSSRRRSTGMSINQVHAFSGMAKEDRRTAGFVGMCAVKQDCFVIVDRWNRKLKLVYLGGQILFCLEFGEDMEPWDVTYISDGVLAVTCPSYRHIVIVSVQSKTNMDVKTYIPTAIGYASLTALPDQLFAAGVCKPFGDPRVDIVDMCGKILTTFKENTSYPRTLDTTSEGGVVVCDWSQKIVRLYDRNHQLKTTFTGSPTEGELREPTGLGKDGQGCIFIADLKSKRIHVVNEGTGLETGSFALKIQQDPKVICVVNASSRFSRKGKALVVATNGGDIFVFDMVR